MMMDDFKNKKILLGVYDIANYAEAELTCLQLAIAFRSFGASVEVATLNYALPAKREFEKNNITVKNVLFDELNDQKYDLIWLHHNILADYVLFQMKVRSDLIIYSSLSPFEPLEAVPEYVSSLSCCLTNSEETRHAVIEENGEIDNIQVFPNFVPKNMLDYNIVGREIKEIRKIAIVSNHLPEELLNSIPSLEKLNIKADIFEIGYKVEPVDKNVLLHYDAVITAGKTVQYCMALGIPVYCYDIHGGPGWLHRKIINKAAYFNFSGRGFTKKTAEEIVYEIQQIPDNAELLKNYTEENYCLETNLKRLLHSLPASNLALLYQKEKGIARRNQAIISLYRLNMQNEMKLIESSCQSEKYSQKVHELQNVLTQKQAELNQQEEACCNLVELCTEKDATISRVISSKSWKLTAPFRSAINVLMAIKKLFHRLKEALSRPPIDEQKYPLVTVCIPVYDRTDFLIQSIESILNQTYPNIEIIAVCDGSPQETLNIVRQYEREQKIRAFYYPDNSGNAVRGRNKAIREAKGQYFAFQDSDDIAAPKRIAASVACMNSGNVDVVYGGWRAMVDGSRTIDIKDGQEIFSPDCDLEMLKKICVPCQSTVMVRTEALRKVGGLKTEMRYREDHELWLRLAYAGYRFKAVHEIFTDLRLHKNNLELSFLDSDDQWFQRMQSEYTKIVPMKPKIAYIIPGCGISGGIAVICQHLNRLKKRGYDVLMISESGETEIPWFPNQTVDIVPVPEAPDNIDYLVATAWTTAYTAAKIQAKQKCYFVQSDETRFNPKGSKEYFMALKSYKMDFTFITEAKWIKQWLHDHFGHNAFYVPNGLDTRLFHLTDTRDSENGRKVRVLLEGPIDIPYKGMNLAFEAVKDIDCEVWCISSCGIPKPEWHCDRFFNKVPIDQMKYIYSSCDIFLKMSQVEGFFGPPMEMMACKGACVVGKVTGYDEYIIDRYNALVVEAGDVKAAHDAVQELIDNKELRETISQNGYETAMQWEWEKSIDLLENVFLSIE